MRFSNAPLTTIECANHFSSTILSSSPSTKSTYLALAKLSEISIPRVSLISLIPLAGFALPFCTIILCSIFARSISIGECVEIITCCFLEISDNTCLKLWIDFGDQLGIKKSSAQITHLYEPERLIGRQVIAIVNFPPKQIGPFISECLVLGCTGEERGVTLLQPERNVAPGCRIQ